MATTPSATTDDFAELPITDAAAKRDVVVLSHLRWDFVWQRPQHLISRLASKSERTWFVEEPVVVPDCEKPRLRSCVAGPVTRVWLEVPGTPRHCGFQDRLATEYAALLRDLL